MHKALFFYFLAIAIASATLAQQASQPSQSDSEPNWPFTYFPGDLPPYIDGVPRCTPLSDKTHLPPDEIYRIGPGVSSPSPAKAPKANFSDEALNMIKEKQLSHFEAVSILRITVDADGKTKDPCLIRSAGYGLDGQAARAVEKYRFNPARMNGKPVPMRIAIRVVFKH